MSNRKPLADQIRHYRELAQIAAECARSNTTHAAEYSEMSRQWFALAERLERDAAIVEHLCVPQSAPRQGKL